MGSLGIAVIAKGGHLYSGPHADMYTVPLYSILSMPDPSIHKGTGVPPVRHCGTGCLRGLGGGRCCPISLLVEPTERDTRTHSQRDKAHGSAAQRVVLEGGESFQHMEQLPCFQGTTQEIKIIIIHLPSLTPKLPVYRWVQFKSVDRMMKYFFFSCRESLMFIIHLYSLL